MDGKWNFMPLPAATLEFMSFSGYIDLNVVFKSNVEQRWKFLFFSNKTGFLSVFFFIYISQTKQKIVRFKYTI